MTCSTARCPACGSGDLSVFFESAGVPAFCNVLWPDEASARSAARGDLRLAHCGACGLVYNVAFEEKNLAYGGEYENSLHFSPRFQDYADGLSRDLVTRHGLHGRQVVEIGCGQGDFLCALCKAGGNRGRGYDPSYNPAKAGTSSRPDVTIHARPFTATDDPADLVVCRHVLEHIARPLEFLRGLRTMIGDRPQTALYFEVPNAPFMFRDLSVWDVIYEHVSYFAAEALTNLFRAAGFEPLDVRERYDGQFLSIESRPAEPSLPPAPRTDATTALVAQFAANFRQKIQTWQARLAGLQSRGQQAVVWGAGSKGVMFLNHLAAPTSLIPAIVDLNPRKHGKHVPGAAQVVIPPESLRDLRPAAVIVMNPIYRGEIEATLRGLGLAAEVLLA